jgi:hypothetical protein
MKGLSQWVDVITVCNRFVILFMRYCRDRIACLRMMKYELLWSQIRHLIFQILLRHPLKVILDQKTTHENVQKYVNHFENNPQYNDES